PPHVTNRVVVALLLVARVVTSRPVRAGDLERQLFLVKILAGALQPGNADEDNAAALAAHQGGLMDWFAAPRGRGDDDRVAAAAAREALRSRDRIVASGDVDRLGAERPCELEPHRVHINTKYPASVCAEQLHGKLTDQPEAGD